MSTTTHLAALSQLTAPPGREGEVRDYLTQHMQSLAAIRQVSRDPMGNLIGERPGKGPLKIMLAPHMDEVGFIVYHVNDDGFLKLEALGSWDKHILPGMTVLLMGKQKVRGIFGMKPPHLLKGREQAPELSDLWLDTGYTKAELEELGITVGSCAVPDSRFEVVGKRVMGKALDNRVGCAVLLGVLEQLGDKPLDAHLYPVATCQEEVGARGGQVAARRIGPHLAIILEGTVASDVPGVAKDESPTIMGEGPALTVLDRGMVANWDLLQLARQVADERRLPYQLRRPRAVGGTDAGTIHLTDRGVPSVVISVPCRYIHSPAAILQIDDFEGAVHLTTALVESLTPERLAAHGLGMLLEDGR